ncbi:hypothetical protein C8Q75DRAFT_776996 [Abortiporus biennis]|nr:hypothetical protein C8Q75DRAFT_776996 [Abortiporus biennis]
MPPQYHLKSFWEARFNKEHHFEWLGDGKETIIPPLHKFLTSTLEKQNQQTQERCQSEIEIHHHTCPRLLHIGAGTSALSNHVLDEYRSVFEKDGKKLENGTIVNTDFSEIVVERGNEERKKEEAAGCVCWEKGDMLKWEDVVKLVVSNGKRDDLFSVIIDKSTSDAISCGEDIVFSEAEKENSPTPSPLVQSFLLSHFEINELKLPPMEVLALHLASVTKPGGIWIALSYSNNRFSFLNEPTKGLEGTRLVCGLHWKLEDVYGVDAPSGQEGKEGVSFAPVVQHHVYVLRRTDTICE